MPCWDIYTPNILNKSKKIIISSEEFYSLVLCFVEETNMKDSATKMGISASTFCRLKKNASKKITTALLNGFEIVLDKNCK